MLDPGGRIDVFLGGWGVIPQSRAPGGRWPEMHGPLVSVAIVVCNADRFLAESIESILDQTLVPAG
jgi:hypothetical protein